MRMLQRLMLPVVLGLLGPVLSLIVSPVFSPVLSPALAQTRQQADITGDGLPDDLVAIPSGQDTAVLSIRTGQRGGQTGGQPGGNVSLAIGWCRSCGGPPVAVITPPGTRAADLMVLSPDRQTLRWMRWWGEGLIEQRVFPLGRPATALRALDPMTVDVRFPNGDGMTLAF